METTVLLVIQVVSALVLIGLILIQQGKGADAGASFGGGGGAQSVFGSSGSGNFLTRVTAILATIFFCASLGLTYLGKKAAETDSGLFNIPAIETTSGDEDLPVVPGGGETADGDLPAVELPTTDDVSEAEKDAVEAVKEDLPEVSEESMESAATEVEAAAVSDVAESVEAAVQELDVPDIGSNPIEDALGSKEKSASKVPSDK